MTVMMIVIVEVVGEVMVIIDIVDNQYTARRVHGGGGGGGGEENKWEAGNKQSYPPLVGVKGKVCKVVQELDAGSQLVHVIMMVII